MSIDVKLLKDATDYADKWLEFQFRNSRLPGFAAAVQQDNRIIFSKAYGFANLASKEKLTTEHYFRIASHSKMFTATAVMLLVEREKLQLDDNVSKHLAWFKSASDPEISCITIRQLLSHSSGFIRDGNDSRYWQLVGDFPDEAFLKNYIQQAKVVLKVNSTFKYSNFGYSYLGSMIKQITGQEYSEFVTENIIKKLGLKNTGPDLDDKSMLKLSEGHTREIYNSKRKPIKHISTNGMAAATGFYSTIADLCRFAAAQSLGNEELLKDSSKREMQRLQWKIPNEEEDYGLGFALEKIGSRKTIGHGGGFPGFITKTYIDPKDKLVVTVLTNAQEGPAQPLACGIIKIINYFQDEGSKKHDTKQDLSKFEGRFFNIWGVSDIVKVGQSLVTVFPVAWDPFSYVTKLNYKSPTELEIDDTSGYLSEGELIKYHFDQSGKVRYINNAGMDEYHWNEYKKRFVD